MRGHSRIMTSSATRSSNSNLRSPKLFAACVHVFPSLVSGTTHDMEKEKKLPATLAFPLIDSILCFSVEKVCRIFELNLV